MGGHYLLSPQVLLAGLEEYGRLEGRHKGYYDMSRWIATCVCFLLSLKTLTTTYSSNSNMIVSHHALSRYHAGALWLEALRRGEKDFYISNKSELLGEAEGLTSGELDNIVALIAAANDLLDNE